MTKIRVHEIAKQLSLTSKEVVVLLTELNIDAKSHMSAIDEKDANTAIEHFKNKSKTGAAPAQTVKPEIKEDLKKEVPPVPEITEKEIIPQPSAEAEAAPAPVKKPYQKKQAEEKEEEIVELTDFITLGDLARLIKTNPIEIIKDLLNEGILLTINQKVDFKKAEEIALKYKYVAIKKEAASEAKKEDFKILTTGKRINRPPVVTVLGHVDHGKTSLLDAIRKTDVASGEAGGITQRIGASSVVVKGKKIIFIDTPGHEAFTSMRARGAKVTDIAVLIVAADDGIMPQTIEAIDHAKAAKVPIIVAINKIDMPQANPERVKQQLTDHELLSEDWGGDTICVNISAKKNIGVDELLDMILLVSEMQDIKTDPEGTPVGTIIESKVDKGFGPVATVLIQNGTVNTGDFIIAGAACGKIRVMINDKGERINQANASSPVEIIGFTTVPVAGDTIELYNDEKLGRQIVEKRLSSIKDEKSTKQHTTLNDLFKQITSGNVQELDLVIKADGQGAIEALKHALLNIRSNEVGIKILHTGVGAITETDVMLASASNAIIIGFNVKPDGDVFKLAESESVDIRLYKVIYNVIDDVKAALTGMLAPEYEEVMLGRAQVKQVFKISNSGIIAGCQVNEGKIKRNANARILRGKDVVYEGKISSLKRFKDDVKEVLMGYECGISVEKFGGIQSGDIIEAYEMEEKKRSELILNESAN